MRRRAAPALALLALTCTLPATANAAAQLRSPVRGATVGSHPLLRWFLPADEEAEAVYIARRSERAADGAFPTAYLEDTGLVSGKTRSYRSPNGLYQGTHWWVVVTRDRDFDQHTSRVGRFRVGPALGVARTRVDAGPRAGERVIRMRLITNARRLRFRLEVRQGGRLVQTVTRRASVRNPGEWGTRNLHWLPSAAVERGRPARLTLTVIAGPRRHRTVFAVTP